MQRCGDLWDTEVVYWGIQCQCKGLEEAGMAGSTRLWTVVC